MYELYVNGEFIESGDTWAELDQDAWDYRVRGCKVEIISKR